MVTIIKFDNDYRYSDNYSIKVNPIPTASWGLGERFD